VLVLKIETQGLPGECRRLQIIENALVMERNPVRHLLSEPFSTEGMPEADLVLRLTKDQQVQLATSLLQYALDWNVAEESALLQAVERFCL
jgi:hypothetical protein